MHFLGNFRLFSNRYYRENMDFLSDQIQISDQKKDPDNHITDISDRRSGQHYTGSDYLNEGHPSAQRHMSTRELDEHARIDDDRRGEFVLNPPQGHRGSSPLVTLILNYVTLLSQITQFIMTSGL